MTVKTSTSLQTIVETKTIKKIIDLILLNKDSTKRELQEKFEQAYFKAEGIYQFRDPNEKNETQQPLNAKEREILNYLSRHQDLKIIEFQKIFKNVLLKQYFIQTQGTFNSFNINNIGFDLVLNLIFTINIDAFFRENTKQQAPKDILIAYAHEFQIPCTDRYITEILEYKVATQEKVMWWRWAKLWLGQLNLKYLNLAKLLIREQCDPDSLFIITNIICAELLCQEKSAKLLSQKIFNSYYEIFSSYYTFRIFEKPTIENEKTVLRMLIFFLLVEKGLVNRTEKQKKEEMIPRSYHSFFLSKYCDTNYLANEGIKYKFSRPNTN